ncbi:MAG: ankyrin repeat domain-containing protein [Candidatus Comchoanobacterales bacterium]
MMMKDVSRQLPDAARVNLFKELKLAMKANQVEKAAVIIAWIISKKRKENQTVLSGLGLPTRHIKRWIDGELLAYHHSAKNIKILSGLMSEQQGIMPKSRQLLNWINACRYGDYDVVSGFIKDCFPVNAVDNKGMTGLMYAVKNGNHAIVKVLLDHKKIQIDQQNNRGESALMLAVIYGYQDLMWVLLDRTLDINAVNQNGQNIWMLAIMHQQGALIKDLYNVQGLNLNQQDNEGRSPLMLAAWYTSYPMMSYLLSLEGLDKGLLDQNNYRVWDYILSSIQFSASEQDELMHGYDVAFMVDRGESIAAYIESNEIKASDLSDDRKRFRKRMHRARFCAKKRKKLEMEINKEMSMDLHQFDDHCIRWNTYSNIHKKFGDVAWQVNKGRKIRWIQKRKVRQLRQERSIKMKRKFTLSHMRRVIEKRIGTESFDRAKDVLELINSSVASHYGPRRLYKKMMVMNKRDFKANIMSVYGDKIRKVRGIVHNPYIAKWFKIFEITNEIKRLEDVMVRRAELKLRKYDEKLGFAFNVLSDRYPELMRGMVDIIVNPIGDEDKFVETVKFRYIFPVKNKSSFLHDGEKPIIREKEAWLVALKGKAPYIKGFIYQGKKMLINATDFIAWRDGKPWGGRLWKAGSNEWAEKLVVRLLNEEVRVDRDDAKLNRLEYGRRHVPHVWGVEFKLHWVDYSLSESSYLSYNMFPYTEIKEFLSVIGAKKVIDKAYLSRYPSISKAMSDLELFDLNLNDYKDNQKLSKKLFVDHIFLTSHKWTTIKEFKALDLHKRHYRPYVVDPRKNHEV